MSVPTNNILNLLRDLSACSDKIIEENASELSMPRVSEWISIVKNKVHNIVESESDTESGKIPSLMSFLKGSRQRGPRVSTVLTEFQKYHVHRKGKASIKACKSSARLSSVKTPRRKSGVKGTNETLIHSKEKDTPKLKTPLKNIKAGIVQNDCSSASSKIEGNEQTPPASFSPVNRKDTLKMNKGSKRKSSSELSLGNGKKWKKIDEENDPRDIEKKLLNSTKVEKLVKAKNSSLLPNYANVKSSVGTNVSVLKENRVRSKRDKQEKAIENRTNILALRQQKLRQNKRTREEKMEKTLQERKKMETEKSKLRSGAREKIATKSNKDSTPIAMFKTVAESENHEEASNSKKKNIDKEKEIQTSVKKLQMNLNKIGPSVLKSIEKNPVKKNPKFVTEKLMNTTYATIEQQPSTSSKGEISKGAKIDTNSGIIKDALKIYPKTPKHTKGIKIVPKAVKPLIEQQKQPINSANSSTPVQKKSPESYAITPSRSSFVSYDISEIRSDSEDEDQVSNSKPIPSWAVGVHLRNALLQQHHHPIDSDVLFGNYFDTPDLAKIMGVKKKHYNKRTSSALWNSSFRKC